MKTSKYEIYANGPDRLHLATVYSKGLAFAVARQMTEVYATIADSISVEIGQQTEYRLPTGKAKI